MTEHDLEISAKLLHRCQALGLHVKFLSATPGPVVTVFRLEPFASTRVAQVEALAADFAVATASESVLVKRLPGESAIGVFVPNVERKGVSFRDCVTFNEKFMTASQAKSITLPLNFGIDHLGSFVVEDLSKYPHLLIAGSTGSGKSTLLVSLIASLLYSLSPDEVNFVLSDTKGVEFSRFAGAPHVVDKISTSVYETCEQMEMLVGFAEERLKAFAKQSLRNITEWNTSNPTARMPRYVFVIDELADLLANKSKFGNSKQQIAKVAGGLLGEIAARARASGVHIIASTQRPSVDVVAGVIKANFPARLSFRLPSGADSRTVLGTNGAENLLMQGDALLASPLTPALTRVHTPLTPLEDIEGCVRYAQSRFA